MVKEIIIGIVVVLVAGFIALQNRSFKEWLVFAVTLAESKLGSGTGQLKLKYVYDLAVTKYPVITKVITFNTFSKLVDKALEKMRTMLEENKAIDDLVKFDKL